MSISVYQDIQADVSTTSYIKVNAKQNDSNTRHVRISCCNLGEPLPLQAGVHSAFLRLRKADGYGALNKCEISPDGKIIALLTEQMLAAPGTCCADLMIFDLTDPATGKPSEPFDGDGNLKENIGSMLSTMPFYVNVTASALDDAEIVSSDEFSDLKKMMAEAQADYSCVMRHAQKSATEAKSYAVGGTNSRDGEDSDNASYMV